MRETPPTSRNTTKLITLQMTVYIRDSSTCFKMCYFGFRSCKACDFEVSTTNYKLYSGLFDRALLKNNFSVLFKGPLRQHTARSCRIKTTRTMCLVILNNAEHKTRPQKIVVQKLGIHCGLILSYLQQLLFVFIISHCSWRHQILAGLLS